MRHVAGVDVPVGEVVAVWEWGVLHLLGPLLAPEVVDLLLVMLDEVRFHGVVQSVPRYLQVVLG